MSVPGNKEAPERDGKRRRHFSDPHVPDRSQDPGLDKDNSSIYRKNSGLWRRIRSVSGSMPPLGSQGTTEANVSSHQPVRPLAFVEAFIPVDYVRVKATFTTA